MGARGRDRTGGRDRAAGRALPLGWGDEPASASPTGPSDPTGSSAPPEGAAPRRLSTRTRRLLAIGSVLALVAALFVGLPRLLSTTAGPERVTADFLHAVIDGDLETVLAQAEHAADASAAALTAQVLREAHDQLESFEIQHVEVTADTARVTASLHTAAASGEAVFSLTAADAGPFSPLAWELTPVALPEFVIDVPFGAQEIAINGVSFPIAQLAITGDPYASRVTVQLLPGTYEISLPGARRWLEASPLAFEAPPTFGNWRKPLSGLQYDLSEDGLQEVQRQIDAALEHCATETSSAPAGCPFAVPEAPTGAPATTAVQGTWALTEPAHIELHRSDAFLWMVYGTGTAEFTPSGSATGGTAHDEAGAAAPIEVAFEVDGAATLDGKGELAVALRSTTSLSYAYCVDVKTGNFTGVTIIEDLEDATIVQNDCA
ncbi:hypothetical protein GCM10023160_07800 [Brachybacterium paraconglomeratum]|uniref:hypothetical protein n=1 Tax=Brachybacterium paraconglomeratum TaxID=173362 RepID=UPI0031ED6974